jgi:hypothetical protein
MSLQLSDCCPFGPFSIFGARIVPHQNQKHDEGSGALKPENDIQRQQVDVLGDNSSLPQTTRMTVLRFLGLVISANIVGEALR